MNICQQCFLLIFKCTFDCG